ncbi:hypothetical protein N431DRAFT_488194 [Stipitochalara longipes BDJ]|nr:hypothetical protein N431DRAFT_488194 [Stipitochalara longipes BDJ]
MSYRLSSFYETVEVFISSDSLHSLEELSNDATKSAFVKHIKLNLSHYDASYVGDKGLYASNCYHWHLVDCDFGERFSSSIVKPHPSSEFDAIKGATFDETHATPIQQEILKNHRDYVQKFNDQEALRNDGTYITRLSAALSQLPNITSITINDEFRYVPSGLRVGRSPWKSGPHQDGAITTPPVEIIPQLFQALKETPIRPAEFNLKLGAPRDLQSLQLDNEQQSAIKKVLEHSRISAFAMSDWGRGAGSDDTRSREEILALGAMTKAVFSTPNLESVALSLSDFLLEKNPQPTLSYLLPLAPEDQWQPRLRKLRLQWVSSTPSDLQILVDKFRQTLVDLDLWYCHLAEGQWEEVFDILRGFTHLKEVRCAGCSGGEIGFARWQGPKPFPAEDAKSYLLGENGASNPLRAPKAYS